MKFNFDHISYTDVEEQSELKDTFSACSNTDRAEAEVETTDTEKYVNTLLDQSLGTTKQGDTISDFYSDLKLEKNLAINKNTADRHGRK